MACALGSLTGCTPPVEPIALPALDPRRFPHAQHTTTPCAGCHVSDQAASAGHAPCDASGCHRSQFQAAPSPFCLTCHTTVQAQPLRAPLRNYPPTDRARVMPARIAHGVHLQAAAMERAVGFHLACQDCHPLVTGEPQAANHATCERCHTDAAKLSSISNLRRCDACHLATVSWRRSPSLIRGDIRFAHADHQRDRRGAPIACNDCHRSAAAGEVAPVALAACVVCHDDTARVLERHRMRACETCHRGKVGGWAVLAPRNHLPATERPVDHTLAFRTNHAIAAENAARCASCHREVSGLGGPQSSCDECHAVRRPADHRLTWREMDHGADATATPDRCARCHVVDYCTQCHRQRPRSHGPALTTWSHGVAARTNVRACLVCHQVSSCQGSGCHEGAP